MPASALNYFKDGRWVNLASTGVLASGGTVTDIVDGGVAYKVHTFTSSDDFVVTRGGSVEYLIVAGGGGAGGPASGNSIGAGGGGGGAVLLGPFVIAAGTYPVVVGAGGAAGVGGSSAAANGGDSSALSLTASGGGGGATQGVSNNGANGGSGGGSRAGGSIGIGSQGGDGGTSLALVPSGAGGGGGADTDGGNGTNSASGDGGDGLSSSITGSAVFYGGGGGGSGGNTSGFPGGAGGLGGGGDAGDAPSGNGASGTDGLGGGGGAAGGQSSGGPGVSGDGGDGVVIIRYRLTYNPYPTVTIDGVDFTGDTVGSVLITRGRDTVYLDPPAGYARIQLVDLTGNGLDVNIARRVEITMLDSLLDPVTVFAGQITDVAADLYDPGLGANQPAAIYSVFAVGPLARLARRTILTGGRPAETDGDRVLAAINDGLAQAWEETPGTWADVDPTLTWATFDADYDPTIIDPGVFDLIALPTSDLGYSALEVATVASNSGEGLLYETLDGRVGWANADARGLAGTPTSIPADAILSVGLRSSSSLGDLANRVTVDYATGSETAQDDVSLELYTRYERRISTTLANSTSAADRAEAYVQRHAYPAVNLGEVAIRLDSLTDPALRDALITLYSGSPVTFPDLPATIGLTRLDAFVEGTSLRLDRFTAELRLNVSDAALSRFAVRWSGVDPTYAWSAVSATLTWADATTVTT